MAPVKKCSTCLHLSKAASEEPCNTCVIHDKEHGTKDNWVSYEQPTTVSALDMQVGGAHYKAAGIQPIQYIRANQLDFFEGNVVKYVTRWKTKNGVQDLKKARHYLDMLIEFEEKTA